MSLITPQQAGLKWLFLDLNSYFASVEQNENPALIGKPVAVVPMVTDGTCAIAASYEAKRYGIRTGTKIFEAKKMCPELICILARHNIYVDYHNKILQSVDKHLPVNKVWSIDEFDCVLLGREKNPENAARIAQRIKDQLKTDLGPAITCSIGIAPNSFLGKVATEIEKPNGLVLLTPDDLPGRLLDLKLTDLPGINVAMEARLHRARITTIEALWNTSPKQARAIWGSVQGERFWYWLHGYDVPYQATSSSMIGHSRVLDPDLRTPEKTYQMARRLLVKASARLRRKGFYATRLIFSVRLIDGPKVAFEAQFPAAHDPFTFLHHLTRLWNEMSFQLFGDAADRYARRTLFKKVAIILYGLRTANDITDDLFDTSYQDHKEMFEKRENLTAALDHLQAKYKSEIVTLGLPPKTLAGHVGTKIAFSRVPDREEFWT